MTADRPNSGKLRGTRRDTFQRPFVRPPGEMKHLSKGLTIARPSPDQAANLAIDIRWNKGRDSCVMAGKTDRKVVFQLLPFMQFIERMRWDSLQNLKEIGALDESSRSGCIAVHEQKRSCVFYLLQQGSGSNPIQQRGLPCLPLLSELGAKLTQLRSHYK
jgi:hypothetical protein